MALNFGREKGTAEVLIDRELCTVCGVCVEVCKGGPLVIEEDQLAVYQETLFGCLACGACVAACPMGAIQVSGRDLFPQDILPLEDRSSRSSYAALQQLFLARRSTRNFQDREVDPDLIQKILDSAATSPMGVPPSNVGVLVFEGRQAVHSVQQDLAHELPRMMRFLTPVTVALMRPFISRDTYEMYNGFVLPTARAFMDKNAEGVDWIFYDAPLAFYFYGDESCDPGDPIVAASCAMFAAESLDLGTCMLGFPPYLFQYSPKLRKKYALPAKIQPGIMLICGYPQFEPLRAIRRRFGRVERFHV